MSIPVLTWNWLWAWKKRVGNYMASRLRVARFTLLNPPPLKSPNNEAFRIGWHYELSWIQDTHQVCVVFIMVGDPFEERTTTARCLDVEGVYHPWYLGSLWTAFSLANNTAQPRVEHRLVRGAKSVARFLRRILLLGTCQYYLGSFLCDSWTGSLGLYAYRDFI